MTKQELTNKTDALYNEIKNSLTLIWSNLNHGQQNKLLKNDDVKALLVQYKIIEE